MRFALAVLLLVGCGRSREADPAVSTRRDSNLVDLVPPQAQGNVGSHLGTVLVHCDDDFLAAGVDGLVWADSNVAPFLDPAPQAEVLSCVGPSPHLAVAGGSNGLWRYSLSTWEQISDAGVTVFARQAGAQTVIVVGQTTRVLSGVMSFNVGGRVAGAAWSRSGSEFVVVTSTAATLFDWSGTSVSMRANVAAPMGETFASTVALADLHPAQGLEVAVGLADGGVLIFNEFNASPLLRYDFGSSLAIEGSYSGGLDALMVGDPEAGRVVLMVGDAGVQDWSFPDAGRFGATVATGLGMNLRDLAVGAPDYGGGSGAVFLYRRFRIDPPGTALPCDVAAPCSSPTGTAGVCTSGTCVGGVLCANEAFSCPADWECVLDHCTPIDAGSDAGEADAGAPDAGETDAGVTDAGATDAGATDAGATDAGATDAGETDAGSGTSLDEEVPTEFIASSCAVVEVPMIGVWLVALGALRRKRLSARSSRATRSRRD